MKKKQKKKVIKIIISLVVILIAVLAVVKYEKYKATPGALDTFAACLEEKGVVMYGASWCPHCNDQKRLFGKSAKKIPYIECAINGSRTAQAQACVDADISSYPTWKFDTESLFPFFDANPEHPFTKAYQTRGVEGKLSGLLPLEIISEVSGCVLPVLSEEATITQ